MIKVELTKNIFNQRGGGLFGLKPIQLVFAAVAVIIGGLTVLWLMQYGMSTDLIGWSKKGCYPKDGTENNTVSGSL